jgi:pyruvate formate lyase activating enzyme
VDWYYDPLPTNCCADWVCPGGSHLGYPRFSHARGAERGYKNLAVFYRGCSFNCLYCQNWHFRQTSVAGRLLTAEELASAVDRRTSCICYFGGDPSPFLPHAIRASRLALVEAQRKNRILRICWETNGGMNRSLLKSMAKLSLESGGCIKFDLKAFDENLHIALCGASNRTTLDNFRYLASLIDKRPEPPFLIATTLLVPGYLTTEEVEKIAKFIACLDPEIPYALLAFYPQFYLNDLPTTSIGHASAAREAALAAGLKNVRIGNRHLLSDAY